MPYYISVTAQSSACIERCCHKRSSGADTTKYCSHKSSWIAVGYGMSLEEFKEKYFRPFLLTREEYGPSCKIKVEHDAPVQAAAIGGDSVQGL